MLVKILPGEYIFNSDGYNIYDERGYAVTAIEELDVEVENEAQLEMIAKYQAFVRPVPEVVEEPVIEPVVEPVVEPEASL